MRPLLQKVGANPDRITMQIVTTELDRLPKATGTQTGMSAFAAGRLHPGPEGSRPLKDEYTSTEHLLLALTDR